MPPQPFPVALRLGIDTCYIPRVQALLSKYPSGQLKEPRFLSKLLTWPERQYFLHRFGDAGLAAETEKLNKMGQFLAGRWAAKEACRKACEHFGKTTQMQRIIILPVGFGNGKPGSSRRPQGLILREAIPPLSRYLKPYLRSLVFNLDEMEGQLCEVSITHDGDYAQAVALVPEIK
ncbi:hypothetical protein M011DRAFT_476175 [Sporormia fimetaria CBS 119925]|uniref:4'-phosphopantetheinyl transferase domain-containing protein n=1 Tax=Sporormia fimetaria CBS 119925 TaxID=1340428 RepID=A0A6A6VGT0_9PLEO|nr:hypothetical protein M011DRAFT_476175 [Sporormia fimetaria CBS 119925]